MTLIDRYFTKRLLGAFLKSLAALIALYVIFDLLTHRSGQIAARDVPWNIVAIYYLSQIPFVITEYQVAALAILVAGLIVFGRAAQDQEIVATLSAGLSLRRVVCFPALLVLLVSLGVFALQETLGVAGAATSYRIQESYFNQSEGARQAGVSWSNLPNGWTCHVLKFNRDALTGENVLMTRYRPEQIERVQARRIYWEPALSRWLLEDGLWSTYDPRKGMQGFDRRITQLPAPLAETPQDLFALDAHPATEPLAQLRKNLKQARVYGIPTARAQVDLYSKFARPLLPFIMFWLAAPFALRLRRGTIGAAFGISIAIGLIYLVAFISFQTLGHLGRIPPIAAAWTPNVVFLSIGAILFVKTPT